MKTGKCSHEALGHEGAVRALALSADASELVSGGGAGDCTVRHMRWDEEENRFIRARTFTGHKSVVRATLISTDELHAYRCAPKP